MAGGAKHEQWSSKLGFVLAAIGGAVGLGNIWRFSYLTGENGGGAFVLVYVASVFLVAIPILIAELSLGKRGHKDIVSGTEAVAVQLGKPRYWQIIGWLGMLAAFFVLTYYSVVSGQVLDYIVQTATGSFSGISPEEARLKFDFLRDNPLRMFIGTTVVMGLTMFVVAKGVTGGIEKTAKIMMPAFFVMLIGLFFYSVVAGDFAAGWAYMFHPDFSAIHPTTILAAIGQAFFSIGISFGYMLAYGSYLPDNVSIPKTSVIICLADTGVAITAGLVIFPLVFKFGLEPGQGPELIFRILPMVFSQMQFGVVVGTVFFVLLFFAAFTSCIAILQPAVSYLEERWNMSIKKAALVAGAGAWVLSLGSILSFNAWAGLYPLRLFDTFAESTIMDIVDFVTANYMMLVGGILISLFVGWSFKPDWMKHEFKGMNPLWYTLWLWLVRVFSPAAVAIALYYQLSG
jgi:neurotransmitter:Na+ symporter, NSS family